MLETRVRTALILVTVGLAALFLLPPTGFALAAGLVLLIGGGWEAARLAGFEQTLARWAFAALLGLLAALIWYLEAAAKPLLAAGCVLWLVNFAWLGRPEGGRSSGRWMVAIKAAVLAIVLLGLWLGLVELKAVSPWLVLLLLVTIAAADTCAYFTGRHFGGTKLAPRISPGKTRAGAIGGVIGAAVFTPLVNELIPASPFHPGWIAALAVGLALISIGGDLFISLLKRQRGLKDTSNLLPGHGGILDRFDSMAAAVPFFTLAVLSLFGVQA